MSEEIFNLQKLNLECDSDKYLNIGKNIYEIDQGKAFSFLSLGLSLNSIKKEAYYDLYFNVLERWSNELLENLRYQDALKLFEVAQEIYPNSADFNFLLAGVLFRLGKTREAWEYSLKVFRTHRYDPKVRGMVSALSNVLVDRWHIPMINDGTRNNVFRLAIKKCIKDGHTSVFDIGCGSGLLSIYASREGCRSVYACEVDDFMYELAGNVLKLNNSDVHLLNCKSTNIGNQITQRVSLVISETFDAGLFGEDILLSLDHAWDELLLPPKLLITSSNLSTGAEPEIYGKVIPNSADIFLALVECDTIRRQTIANLTLPNGKCVQLKLEMTEPYLSEKMEVIPGKYRLLSSWKDFLSIDFNSPSAIKNLLNNGVKKNINFDVERDGRLDGLILAFKLHLDDEHSIETFPESNTCWENALFPFNLNNLCKVGDVVRFEMSFEDVLKFRLIEPKKVVETNKESQEGSTALLTNAQSHSTFKTTDSQMLKCINSKSFKAFFRLEAQKLSNYLNKTHLNILDTCDYPEGGMTFLEINPTNKLFVNNPNALKLINQAGIRVYPSSDIPQKVDVIIFWPFTKEGTLIDNFTEELTRFRNLLTDGGRIIPECLEIQTIGIESSRIERITRINDRNTCGVKIEEVFNLVKTHHHLDIPLEEISYKPMSSIITPVRLLLNDLDTSFQDFIPNLPNSLDGLTVGGKSVKKIIRCATPSTGNIVGFAYWFEMSGLQEQTSPSCTEAKDSEDFVTLASGETLSPQSFVEEESILSTFSSDSPMNQCILLLDNIRPVTENEILEVHFTMCEGLFSIHIVP